MRRFIEWSRNEYYSGTPDAATSSPAGLARARRQQHSVLRAFSVDAD